MKKRKKDSNNRNGGGKKRLREFKGKRLRFKGRVERFGLRNLPGTYRGFKKRTVLIVDLENEKTGEVIADHAWLDTGLWSKGILAGYVISFEAKVLKYEKGYKGFAHHKAFSESAIKMDYRLHKPSKMRVLTAVKGE